MKNIITCKICGNRLRGRQTSYCSQTCKNRSNQSYQAQQARGLKRKRSLINKLGGCCQICGYNTNLAALTFHHRRPSSKNFKLDMRSLSNRKQDRINTEIKKCILVCHNCHAELHNPKHNFK